MSSDKSRRKALKLAAAAQGDLYILLLPSSHAKCISLAYACHLIIKN